MKKNMGKVDRVIRLILGLVMVGVAVFLQLRFGMLWWIGILGVVFIATSAISFCPLYLPFKINTDK